MVVVVVVLVVVIDTVLFRSHSKRQDQVLHYVKYLTASIGDMLVVVLVVVIDIVLVERVVME